MEPVKKPKGPSFIIDAGCGKAPAALLRKAAKSCAPNASPGMKRRLFVGIDKVFNVNKLVRKTGLAAKPENIDLVESCAVRLLAKGQIKTKEESAKPTIFIFRKPRKKEKIKGKDLAELSDNLRSAIQDDPITELINALIGAMEKRH